MLYYGFTVLLAVTVNIFMLLHAVHMLPLSHAHETGSNPG